METTFQVTLEHDVNLNGFPLKAGSTLLMEVGTMTLATACRLAGIAHEDYLRIRAYMPVQDDISQLVGQNKLLELARMAGKINTYGDIHNGLTRLKAQRILSQFGEGPLDDLDKPEELERAKGQITMTEGIDRVMRKHRPDCASLTRMLISHPPRPAACDCGAQP